MGIIYPDDAWRVRLSEGRREKIMDKFAEQKRKRLDPPLLEFTDFADKRAILGKTLNLGKRFERELKSIEDLRNSVSHAGNYADGEEGLQRFAEQMRLTERWIADLQSRIKAAGNEHRAEEAAQDSAEPHEQ